MKEEKTEAVWTIVKFSFTLNQLVIELFEAGFTKVGV